MHILPISFSRSCSLFQNSDFFKLYSWSFQQKDVIILKSINYIQLLDFYIS